MVDTVFKMCKELVFEIPKYLGVQKGDFPKTVSANINERKLPYYRKVLGKPRQCIFGAYKAAFPNCPHGSVHVCHGVFKQYVENKEWIKKFWKNKYALIFAKPNAGRKAGLALLSSNIIRSADLKCRWRDQKELEHLGCSFEDIHWSVSSVDRGDYYEAKDEDGDVIFLRKYK